MDPILTPFFWYFVLVLAVWIYRARLALATLKLTPVINPLLVERPSEPEKVSVIIPAKNEENNIRECLTSLLNQDYPNYEIIVINDNSTDGTETILKAIQSSQTTPLHEHSIDADVTFHSNAVQLEDEMLTPPSPIPFRYINNLPTPEGWTGKNFAIHNGVFQAKGKWFLFTDADTRHSPTCISSTMAHVQAHDLDFLTLLPHCLASGIFENIIQPLAMAFMGLYFPTSKINDPKSDVCFGNGQFILMRASVHHDLGGHEAVKGEFLEDFALNTRAKKSGLRTQVAFGTEVFGTRMYNSLVNMWRGWRRIYLHAFKRRTLKLVQTCMATLLFSVLPFLAFVPLTKLAFEDPWLYGVTWGMALPILIMIIATSWKAHTLVKAPPIWAIFHPLAAFFMSLVYLDAAWKALTGQRTKWR